MADNQPFKLHIVFKFVDGAWGGGNQFLKALRAHLLARGLYADRPSEAQAFLFNSHHELRRVEKLRRQYPQKAFIHRVDGPIHVVRGNSRELDAEIFGINERLADGTIFQSRWSMEQCLEQGMREPQQWCIINNAPDPAVFSPSSLGERGRNERIRLVAASWSTNAKKGFDIYEFLDKHLDYSRFEMTYIGNSPIGFENIRHMQPLPSRELAEEFRKHDIFISASMMEACSNAIVEAMNCGLVPVVRNNSSQPELAGDPTLVFNGAVDLLDVLERLASNLEVYRHRLRPSKLDQIGVSYSDFCSKVCALPDRKPPPKLKSGIIDFLKSALLKQS